MFSDYLDLTAAIEDTAAHLSMPVILEGYGLPFDPRIQVLQVTPDPGVIEVNIHPAESWDALVRTTEAVYSLARETRLGAEKFMLDGQHSGTGGGNHIVIGGPTPEDSPFLRRPDLLRSLVGYWHNHPSLSYLFSGMFIGPTSQHPVSMKRAPMPSTSSKSHSTRFLTRVLTTFCPGTLIAFFRHLLTDLSGNTHRAEFCIDKLYSPTLPNRGAAWWNCGHSKWLPHARMSLYATTPRARADRTFLANSVSSQTCVVGNVTSGPLYAPSLRSTRLGRRDGGPARRRLRISEGMVRAAFEFRFPDDWLGD